MAIGDITWTDYEVTVPVTVHEFNMKGFHEGGSEVGVFLKWPGHSDWTGDQPTYGWYPAGGGGWVRFGRDGSGVLKIDDFALGGVSAEDPLQRVIAIGTTHIWKLRVESEPDGSALYRMKVWVEGSPEPADWELVDTEPADVPSGCVLLIAHFTDVSLGNVVIEAL